MYYWTSFTYWLTNFYYQFITATRTSWFQVWSHQSMSYWGVEICVIYPWKILIRSTSGHKPACRWTVAIVTRLMIRASQSLHTRNATCAICRQEGWGLIKWVNLIKIFQILVCLWFYSFNCLDSNTFIQ